MLRAQFSLRRLFLLVFVVAVISALFARFPWPLATLVLAGLNAVACPGFWLANRSSLARGAAASAALFLATLLEWLVLPFPAKSGLSQSRETA